MNLGYACINMSMGKKVSTNRTMVKRTFQSKGLDYVSELALANASDIIKILEWNRLNGINFFRLSSAIIPWGDHIDLTQLKDYKEIKSELKKAGDSMGLQKLPKNSCKVRMRNRCKLTGRPRGYMRDFGISRVTFREMVLFGLIPGVTKSSF